MARPWRPWADYAGRTSTSGETLRWTWSEILVMEYHSNLNGLKDFWLGPWALCCFDFLAPWGIPLGSRAFWLAGSALAFCRCGEGVGRCSRKQKNTINLTKHNETKHVFDVFGMFHVVSIFRSSCFTCLPLVWWSTTGSLLEPSSLERPASGFWGERFERQPPIMAIISVAKISIVANYNSFPSGQNGQTMLGPPFFNSLFGGSMPNFFRVCRDSIIPPLASDWIFFFNKQTLWHSGTETWHRKIHYFNLFYRWISHLINTHEGIDQLCLTRESIGVGLYKLVDCHTMFAPEAGLVQKAAAKEGFSKLAQAEARAMTGWEAAVLHSFAHHEGCFFSKRCQVVKI